jgi:hypothetical protein
MSLDGNINLNINPDFRSFSPENYKADPQLSPSKRAENSDNHMSVEMASGEDEQPVPSGCCSMCSF